MGKFRVIISKNAKKDIKKHVESGNKISTRKIKNMLIELGKHPYRGIGRPEALKGDLKGHWSRRINKKDRLVYRVRDYEVIVEVLSAMGHYSDK